jgi:ribosome modulation factor
MAAGAIQLLEDSQLAKAICGRAHEECRKYSWEAVRQQWLDLYSELANDKAQMPLVLCETESAQKKSIPSKGNVVSR